MNREFLDAIEANPIIAAVKDEQGLANCLRREELTVIFILYGDIRSIGNIVERIHQAGKIAMVHIDLVTGLSSKEVSVDYICEDVHADGIISTKKALLQRAHERGLLTVFQFFAIDTQAVISALDNANAIEPNFIEMMPGLLFRQIGQISSITHIPVIAAGLIKKEQEIHEVLAAGAIALSSSTRALWSYQIDEVSDAEC